MASEDADEVGLRAESVLADGTTALALLGGPDASPAARAAVVQRFGRVGALLVLGYEAARKSAAAGDGVRPRSDRATRRGRLPPRGPRAGLRRRSTPASLYGLLCEIDEDEGFAGDADGDRRPRWLHATYAVAARDGTTAAHRAYMCALDRVMRLVRPLVAS